MTFITELLKNTTVRIALAVVALIAVGAGTYYLIESAPPKVTYAAVTRGTVTDDLSVTGIVTPIQNPTLYFETGGQVRSVDATVGQQVSAGTLLATLDTSVLAANLAAAQAHLNELEAGPRSVDVAGQQTAVASAQQNLANSYTNYETTLQSTLSQAQGVVNADADPLFNFSTKDQPVLTFTTRTSGTKITADTEREELTQEFATWQTQITSASSTPSVAQLEVMTDESIQHLQTEQQFLNDLVIAVNDEEVVVGSTQSQQTTALTQVHAALTTVNGLIATLQTARQGLTSGQLAVQSAQDQLNVSLAGATTEDVQAQQASVAAIEAQIRQQEVVAAFSGTIASVNVKVGDVVSATTPAITLIPQGTFEVDVYVAENDLPSLAVGNKADITLDAYGTGRTFPATIASIDTSPTTQTDGTQGYKVTLVFDSADPAIANGMHASATIHAGIATDVLMVPKTAVVRDGAQAYVLKKAGTAVVKTTVTTGISSDTSIEIISGLSEGDQVSAVGAE